MNIWPTHKSEFALKSYRDRLLENQGKIFVAAGKPHAVFLWDFAAGDNRLTTRDSSFNCKDADNK
jgi:hypothetical protein